MSATAYPLYWPEEFPRSKKTESGRFQTSLAGAIKNVKTSLQRFSVDSREALSELVISSNVTLGESHPKDSAVSVWFTWSGMQVCIAVDRYNSVEGNLQAIHHIIEARRVELRHGTLALVKASFRGFLALPNPSKRKWWEILMVTEVCDFDDAKRAYRNLSKIYHPDKGGSHDQMAELNRAFEEAEEILK